MHGESVRLHGQRKELPGGTTTIYRTAAFVAAVCADIGQCTALHNNLWYRRDFSATKTAAADHEIAQAIQQAVINIVFFG